jgi:LPXTG-site transpeptidase (sortase) family protein
MTVSRRRPHRPSSVRAARVLLAMAASVVLVTGCGGGSDGPSSERSDGPTTTTAARTTEPAPTTEAPSGSTIGTVPATIGEPAPDRVQPAQLRVPSIGVDTEVLGVGVEPDGDMEVPPADVAGWYRFGPTPGEDGSTVLAAHVDYNGKPGAFFRLRELEAGDEVEVTMSDGTVKAYAVTEVEKVPKDQLVAGGVFDRSGTSRVTLITCGGEFDPGQRSYRDNVVAVAEPAG